ncbi:hypothetical protein FHR99_002098 [Litorivivens lipolytica]|uniref:Heparin-sulfate lyase N-terminal domain-containing protein n=1 Tax=Litorivivens lipolytica TaxID=1524264 RepID=A0A7W4W6N5_9GAMM|nr:alginate lyase family protein [Litorivivens lipolytica]MBB3047832.1 hypothetical protein [Litorivivens lipolytica]
MKLQRILKMSHSELAFRSRQRAIIVAERLKQPPCWGLDAAHCSFDSRHCDTILRDVVARVHSGHGNLAKAELQNRLAQSMALRFFTSLKDEQSRSRMVNHLAADLSGHNRELIARANAICRGEFDLLGYAALSFGEPIDWHLDPVAMRKSPLVHWSRIDPLSYEQVGDSKVVWELNRHQWILDLGQAYLVTGDTRYAEQFSELIESWIKANPPCYGINWCSALEASMRIISWCWGLQLFRGAEALTAELFYTMLGLIQRQARYIERNYSRYFSPNTHLTVEALGLFYVGTLLPELEGADRWRSLGRETLLDQLTTQVHPDGGYFEQSTRYQYYTVEIYLHFLILARINQGELPGLVENKLRDMVSFLLQLRRPDGTLPQIGDTDGGCLLPLVRRHSGDYRGLFSTASVLFRNRSFSWAAGELAPEALWLLGDDAQAPRPQPPAPSPLHCFKDSGYAVMRNSWDCKAHQMIVDFGPLGCPVSSGHGHADLLSLQCSCWGENFLVDPGTYCYTADPVWRDHFRSSNAHSTLIIDGQNQAIPKAAFSWHSRPEACLNQCHALPEYSIVDASHTAYVNAEAPITHRRRVLFIEQRYWLVIDDVIGLGEHDIDLRYQFAPLSVVQTDNSTVCAQGLNSKLQLRVLGSSETHCAIFTGSDFPRLGWYSQNYGQRVPAPLVSFSSNRKLPLRLATLIYPSNPEPQFSFEKAVRKAETLLGGLSPVVQS